MNKFVLSLLFLVALISCKKERDEEYPDVNILQPGNLTNHVVLAPIYFKVSASDETNLESITVYLLNDSYLNVTTPQTFICDENSETVEGIITADDIHLPSGTYYLKAVANDGFNQKVTYREIHLTEVPLVLKKAIVVCYNNSSLIYLDSLNGSQLNFYHTINSDCNGFLIDSWNQSVIFAGSFTGALTVQEANYFSPRFTINNNGSGAEAYFTFLFSYENKFYVADRSGKIKSYSKSAQPLDVVDMGNYYSETFYVDENDLISASVFNSGSARSIQKYYIPSGVLQQSVVSNLETKKIFKITNGVYALLGNETGVGKIKIYEESTNSISEPMIFSGSYINDACDLGNGVFLLATQNGVYRVNLLSFTETQMISSLPVHHIKIELISNNIYLSSANTLNVYDDNFNLLFNSLASDSIAEIDFLYNK